MYEGCDGDLIGHMICIKHVRVVGFIFNVMLLSMG